MDLPVSISILQRHDVRQTVLGNTQLQ